MELRVAIIIYSNKAELRKREYMALNNYANTSNARNISSTYQHIEASARRCNIRRAIAKSPIRHGALHGEDRRGPSEWMGGLVAPVATAVTTAG